MSGFASRTAGFGVRFAVRYAAVVAVTTLAVTVLVAPAGAAWAGSSTSAPDPDTNVAETARLERELLKLPGVDLRIGQQGVFSVYQP